MKFIEAFKLLGGVGGIASSAFLIYDRLIRSKPLAYLIPQEYRVHLRIVNMTHETIMIDRIDITPSVLQLIWGNDTRSELAAAASVIYPAMAADEREKKFLVLRPSEERSLSLTYGRLDELPERKRIKIRCQWRNTRSLFPIRRSVCVYTRPQDLLRLKDVAAARPDPASTVTRSD